MHTNLKMNKESPEYIVRYSSHVDNVHVCSASHSLSGMTHSPLAPDHSVFTNHMPQVEVAVPTPCQQWYRVQQYPIEVLWLFLSILQKCLFKQGFHLLRVGTIKKPYLKA